MARYSVGIYWDNVSLHACLIRVGAPELTIERIASLPREYDERYAPKKPISEEIPALLKDALIEPLDTFVVSLPERETMHRSLLRPFGDRKKIAQTIAPEMETLLPVMDGKIIVDYVLLGKDEAGLQHIEAIAVRHASASALIRDMNAAGIDPEIIDSPSAALLAGARKVFKLERDTTYLCLHMGWQDTSLAVLEGTKVKYTGAFPYGFEKIALSLFGNKALPYGQLNEKLKEGIEAGEILDAYIREVLIALSRIGSKEQNLVLILTGYAHSIKDLPAYFKKAADINTDLPEQNSVRGDDGINEILGRFMPLSLACRGIDNTDVLNFRQNDLAYTKKMEWIKGYAGTWTKVAAVFVILWLFGLGLNISANSRINSRLTKLINKEFSAVMPPGTPMTKDVAMQMEQHLTKISRSGGTSSMNGGDSPLEIIADISERVPKTVDVLVDTVSIDENAITITGNAGSYDNVERMKESLAGLSYIADVKIVSANVDKNDQRVGLKLVCSKKSNNS